MALALEALLGTWFIQFTDFPMWLKGDRQNPAITYAALSDPETVRDGVTYTRNGKRRSIVGVDRLLRDNRLRWRGTGLLYPLTSNWQVDHLADDGSWLLISFEKSLFTPAGHDILSREPVLDEHLIHPMLELFRLKYPGRTLQRLERTDP